MQQHNIDIMAIQETKQAFSSTESHDAYTFFFSGKQANRGPAHYGVGFIISPQIKHCIVDCIPVNDRMMKLKISAKGRKYYILNLYAPHSGRPNDEKQNFWDLLNHQCEAHAGSTPCFIVGDMNARIHGKQVSEFDIMGHHTFGRGAGYVQELPGDQLENRQYLIDFCRYNNYIITSTYFSKPPQKQCTFKFSETEGFAAPWTPDRFAQLDHILCPKRWKNAIVNTESRPGIAFDTDHAVLTTNIRIKLGKKDCSKRRKTARFRNPSEQAKMRFNDDIRANFDFCSSRDGVQVNNKNFSQAIKQAAEKFLTKIPTEQKQTYLSEATWGLIENRQAARAQSNSDLEQQLNAAIKRSARCDKKKWKLRMLEDVSSARAKWKGVKFEKSTFKLKPFFIS
jgi:exonuclease III